MCGDLGSRSKPVPWSREELELGDRTVELLGGGSGMLQPRQTRQGPAAAGGQRPAYSEGLLGTGEARSGPPGSLWMPLTTAVPIPHQGMRMGYTNDQGGSLGQPQGALCGGRLCGDSLVALWVPLLPGPAEQPGCQLT